MRSLAQFAGDALEAAVMRGNIRGRLFAAGPAAPTRVGPFELRRQLGRGGMGVVFAAFDPRLKREVALKLVALDRFPGTTGILVEAQALAAIDHANVVRVFSVGVRRIGDELHPRLYIAMERLHGRTLRGWVKQTCPMPAAIVQAYVQAAHGLAAAHRAGVVHGDFKPDNAMIDDAGHVTTMDFSLALRDGPWSTTDRDDVANQEPRPSWTLAGTPGYIAPELMLGDRPTPRSDQWALSASLLEALSGALPCAATLLESPRRLAGRVRIPHRTAAALLRGLALDPRQRFPTADALASALASAPTRRRWLAAIPPLGLGVAALWSSQRAPQCDDAASISDTWGLAERAAVRAGLAATGLPPEDTRADQVVAAFDGYADQLAAAGRRVCDAQRDESLPPHVADAQRSCVERGRRAMAANLEAALEPTAAQSGLIFAAIQRLPSLDRCFTEGDDEFPLPHDPSLVATVQGVREDLAAAVVAAELGQRGTEPFAPLLERATALDHPPLVAAVEVARARHEGVVGDPSLAIAGLELGHSIAVAHGMDGLAAHAATERAMLSVFVDADVEGGQRWLRAARAAAAAAAAGSVDDRLAWQIDGVEFEIAFNGGDLAGAERLSRARLSAAQQRCPSGCADTIHALHEIAVLARQTSRVEEAVDFAERAHTFALEHLGPIHPLTLEIAQLLASTWTTRGDAERAAELLAQVLAARTATSSRQSLELLSTRFTLAQTLLKIVPRAGEAEALLEGMRSDSGPPAIEHFAAMAAATLAGRYAARGEFAAALAADRQAIEIFERVRGESYPQLGTVYNIYAAHLYEAGDLRGALRAAERAWVLWKDAAPDPNPEDAALLLNRGHILHDLGRTVEARAVLQHAVDVSRDAGAFAAATASRAALVDVLRAEARDAEAQTVLEEARRRCDALDQRQRVAANCDLLESR